MILGGDWAYFWGDAVTRSDLAWGRIALLCTRDPTQSTVGLTSEEQAVTRGLLKATYDALRQPVEDTIGWAVLAESIMDRIAADDQTYFAAQAQDFAATYAPPPPSIPPTLGGRGAEGEAIERQGRSLEPGIRFDIPYAIASWPGGYAVELLAISHWREEEKQCLKRGRAGLPGRT